VIEHHVMPDGTIRLGTPIRDAAVDPRPGDYLAPVNAGKANPHGPAVVSVTPWTLPGGRVPSVAGEAASEDVLQSLADGQLAVTYDAPGAA
jgi:hypothetical protein